MHQCYKKYSHGNVCWQLCTEAQAFRPRDSNQKYVHRNAGRKSRWEERSGRTEAKMDRRCQRLVKQNSDSVHVSRETGSNGGRWCMKWSPTLSSEDANKQYYRGYVVGELINLLRNTEYLNKWDIVINDFGEICACLFTMFVGCLRGKLEWFTAVRQHVRGRHWRQKDQQSASGCRATAVISFSARTKLTLIVFY